MSIIKHKRINRITKSKKVKKQNKLKPINKKNKVDNKNLDKIIHKRYLLIEFLFLIFFLFISSRLFKLQIIDYETYLDKLSIATEKTVEGSSAPRGRIYDRNYNLLVDNEAIKTIYYKKQTF